MDNSFIKKIAVDAAMERIVGSTSLPAKYFRSLIKELEKMVGEYKEATEVVAKYDSLIKRYEAEVERIGKIVGEKGDDGYSPVKGKDYFDGKDGYTPVKGKDYFDGKDAKPVNISKIVDTVRAMIHSPKDGEDAVLDYDKIVELLSEKLELEEYKKQLNNEVASYRNQLAGKVYGKDTWARGGGDTVSAGVNVTITTDADGNKVINAAGGTSGSNVTTQYSLIAVQAGSNVTIDLTQLANWATFISLVAVYRNNVPQTETINFTVAGSVLTIFQADAGEIFNATYNYA